MNIYIYIFLYPYPLYPPPTFFHLFTQYVSVSIYVSTPGHPIATLPLPHMYTYNCLTIIKQL